MRRFPRHLLLPIAGLALIVAALAPHGCRQETKTAREAKREFAQRLLQGESIGFAFVKADSADPESLHLYDLRIERGGRVLHADHADILIDEVNGTVSLRLRGVVGADPETGLLISLQELRTGGADLPYKIARPSED